MTHAFIAYMIYSDQVRTGIVQPKRAGQSYSPARSDVSVPSGFAPAAGSSPLARSGYGHSRSKTISAFHTSDPPVSHLEPPTGGYTHPSARHRDTRPADPAPSGQSLGLGGHFSHLGAAHARSVSYSSGPLSSLPNRGTVLSPSPCRFIRIYS
ncbi:hypothetical protein BJ085DRAFT_33452 [Dimargaris cristalligena]|uniref:Uncharacterized protein n=1 Tax=Dimargaris cristalligena TaxID=215637 RepID=A0A4P9ZYT6_9FUNG|nr:hypothetical protein BJ085DRAFT_33452 [Dimargaris cristalligena]|eukprot:RKP38132.1 hypothetical protein BJ085DRAFT_33452 [Dimargaris cristalligena]